MRDVLGILLGLVARVWLATLRLRLVVAPEAARAMRDARPWVLAFWHGRQFPLLAWQRRRKTAVLVSLSADGAMQARALALLGMEVVRGSSSRGGARGLAELLRLLRHGDRDAAFAIDGPRGPHGVAKPGVTFTAERASALVVPMGSAARRAKVLVRAWDRFLLPWPFTEVVVTIGAPLDTSAAGPEGLTQGAVERAVAAEVDRAEAFLAAKNAAVLPFSEAHSAVECGTAEHGPTMHGSVRPSSLARPTREEKVDHA